MCLLGAHRINTTLGPGQTLGVHQSPDAAFEILNAVFDSCALQLQWYMYLYWQGVYVVAYVYLSCGSLPEREESVSQQWESLVR